MPDEPADLGEAVARAEDAFGGQLGRPNYEEGLDHNDHDGYHTSVIEMSFAAIERTLEFYALAASNDTIDDFREGHDRAYDRGAALGLVSEETARRLKQLYRDNRAAAYYRETVAAAQQAEAMFDLAVLIHDHVKEFARRSHECRCRRMRA